MCSLLLLFVYVVYVGGGVCILMVVFVSCCWSLFCVCSLLWLLVFGGNAGGGVGVLMELFVVGLVVVRFVVVSVRCSCFLCLLLIFGGWRCVNGVVCASCW